MYAYVCFCGHFSSSSELAGCQYCTLHVLAFESFHWWSNFTDDERAVPFAPFTIYLPRSERAWTCMFTWKMDIKGALHSYEAIVQNNRNRNTDKHYIHCQVSSLDRCFCVLLLTVLIVKLSMPWAQPYYQIYYVYLCWGSRMWRQWCRRLFLLRTL